MMKLRFCNETMKTQLAIAANRVLIPSKRQPAESAAIAKRIAWKMNCPFAR
jgi:hypothetical protein